MTPRPRSTATGSAEHSITQTKNGDSMQSRESLPRGNGGNCYGGVVSSVDVCLHWDSGTPIVCKVRPMFRYSLRKRISDWNHPNPVMWMSNGSGFWCRRSSPCASLATSWEPWQFSGEARASSRIGTAISTGLNCWTCCKLSDLNVS